jgi:hypothetical protein
MLYALYDEFQGDTETSAPLAMEADTDADTDHLRIVSVQPNAPAPGSAVFLHLAGADMARRAELSAELAKQPLEILRRSPEQLVVRVPPSTDYGQVKLRVLQGERRSKPWVMTIKPLPRHSMLRNVLGGLALFVLGLRTMGRSLRAYAGRRVRGLVGRVTGDPARALSLGVVTGAATQATTAAAALFSGLLGARMLPPMAASLLLIGAQLGAALSAVLLPSFATRDALWVVVVGALWVLLAEDRLNRALGSSIVGAGLIFHGLGLLQDGCAPLLSDPQVVPYLWYLEAGGLTGVFASVAAGAVASALLQGPSLVFALTVSLLQEDVLGTPEALAILSGVNLGAVVNTWSATWAFGSDARRMLRVELALAPVMTGVAVSGLWLWPRIPQLMAAHWSCFEHASAQLGVGFVAMSLCSAGVACVVLPVGTRLRAGRSLHDSLAPSAPSERESTGRLLSALLSCRQGLASVHEIIASGDRSSAPEAERAVDAAQQTLRALMRSPTVAAQSGIRGASVAALHLTDALLSALRIAEKAPELGLTPSGEVAQALEQLHRLIDGALCALCEQLQAGHLPILSEAQAREIEINAAEAEIRRRLFASQSSGDELALRLWSSELCSAYESVGNQVYRAVSAVADDEDL